MALKTFNLDEDIYREFSKHCKENGISMSKKVENFIRSEMDKINGKSYEKRIEFLDSKDHKMNKYC